jgi:uncharacterized protein
MSNHDFSKTGYEAHLRDHKLMGAQCTSCGKVYLPPRSLCRSCFNTEMNWVELEGAGKLIAFTTIHIGTTAMINAGYGRNNPYCTGIIQLDNGPAISAQIMEVDAADPTSIKIGTHLVVQFVDRQVGNEIKTFLAFCPRQD